MKAIVYILAFIVSFVATVLVAAGVTGKLNKESLSRLLNKEPAAAVLPEKDDVGPLAAALKEREKKLEEQEARIERDEQLLALQRRDLEELRTETQRTLDQIQALIEEEDSDRAQRLEDVAKSVENMKATNAAKALDGFDPADAAEILRYVKEKDRGKILDAMDPQKAALLLRSLQEHKF